MGGWLCGQLGGWLGGWLGGEKSKLKLNSAQLKLELGLSLAKFGSQHGTEEKKLIFE